MMTRYHSKSSLESRVRLERWLWFQADSRGLQALSEVTFHQKRKWRIDYTIGKVAIELQGLTWGTTGRHQNPKELDGEYEKILEMQAHGYIVVLITYNALKNGKAYEHIKRALDYMESPAGGGS